MGFRILRIALVTAFSLLVFAAASPMPLLTPMNTDLTPRDASASASSICTIGFNDFSCSTGESTPALTLDASLPTWWPPTGFSWVGRVSECYNLLAPSCDIGTEPDCLGSNVPIASPFTSMWVSTTIFRSRACLSSPQCIEGDELGGLAPLRRP